MQNPVLNNTFCNLYLNNIGDTFLMQFKCVFISMPLFVHGIVFAVNIICVRNGTPGYSYKECVDCTYWHSTTVPHGRGCSTGSSCTYSPIHAVVVHAPPLWSFQAEPMTSPSV